MSEDAEIECDVANGIISHEHGMILINAIRGFLRASTGQAKDQAGSSDSEAPQK